MLTIIPMIIPNSMEINRHAINVQMKGTISTPVNKRKSFYENFHDQNVNILWLNLRFDRHISLISSFSTRKIIAQMMTAANVDFGMNRNESVKNPSDNITRTPVTMPPSVVRTPLALLTAVRVNEPVTGIDWKKAPTKLHIPSANISCVASIVLPFAVANNNSNSLNDQIIQFRLVLFENDTYKTLSQRRYFLELKSSEVQWLMSRRV